MIHDVFLALGFFTRLPVPAHPNFSEQALRRSAVYFPLVGLIVAGLMAMVYLLANSWWPAEIAVLLTMAAGFCITGGFHEDGWADTMDGLGGAFERDKKLAIMTDSRLGTYGSLALWAMLTLKAVLLVDLLPQVGVIVLFVGHSLSRWAAMAAMIWLPYVRAGQSKAKPVVQQLSYGRWLLAALFVALPFYWLTIEESMAVLASAALVSLCWILFLKRQLGGYTGDTLGAQQQLVELAVLLAWLAL
ncbi:adenosylcobinamide-GDP ribazoletransferase [Neiella marina]|uniref:Adenosylcobinamide-GDP ribazoletransferase n=1 Tax=Neiella marina TaxID=508461 RepID=A0A8J2U3U4_9GAMM|nr:adenosylcobinamide-GDP ribazoletransferase [Neiella marina]GGA72415.1 adenosylcobinamide-GDP ribazoletransferase [Neiella marina]